MIGSFDSLNSDCQSLSALKNPSENRDPQLIDLPSDTNYGLALSSVNQALDLRSVKLSGSLDSS